MKRKSLYNISLAPIEKKPKSLSRNNFKQKAPVMDPRRGSRIGIDAISALISDRIKSAQEINMISTALSQHFIFTNLSSENRSMLIKNMKLYTMAPKELVFEQGSPGSNFFVVNTGKLEILVNKRIVNVIGPGDSFGELALLHDSPRTASVVTIDKVTMWGLDRVTFRNALQTVNFQNYQENKDFIDSVPLFNVLTPLQKDSLVGSLSTLKFTPGSIIVKQGDVGDLFYIIKDGIVSCKQQGNLIRQMEKGSFFGEQALLYNTVRTATVEAVTPTKCVALSRNKLNVALGNHLQNIIFQNSKLIAFEKNETLSLLTKQQQYKVIENMKVLRYSDCKVVIQPGTMCGSKLIIVLRGGLRYKNTTIAEVFDCIGEKSMEDYKGETYNDVVTSKGDTYIAEIDKIEYEKCIGNRFITGIMSPEAMNTLKNIQILRSLPEDKFQLLAMRLKTQEFDDKNVIIEQNTPGTNFFIIGSGKVDIVQDGTILRTVTKHDYFGERSILNNNHRTASVIANGQVSCWYLSSNDFMEILEESARTLLLKRIELQDDSITLNDLCIVKLLGKGMFGNVFLVVDKKKHRLYALKTVSRNKILKYEIQENLKLERTILLRLDHLFILKLVKTFKDDQRIYLLTELVKGSDLFDVLRDLNIVTDSEAKFYVACLVVILEYLHDRDIIYRDLKPENIIIDEEGYTKLIDFGISKILNGRTYTIVGTPHYMAPEVIVGKGYNFLADYWSLGVMLYEFLFCSVPFGENEEDPYKVYQKVLEMKLTFPNYLTLKSDTKAMIEQLTSKNPVSRNGGSVQNLKSNPWFSTINWDMLTAKEIPAPYKPKVVDLTQDIETALKNNSSIEKIILKEEIPDFEDNANRRRKKIPNDWDEEF